MKYMDSYIDEMAGHIKGWVLSSVYTAVLLAQVEFVYPSPRITPALSGKKRQLIWQDAA